MRRKQSVRAKAAGKDLRRMGAAVVAGGMMFVGQADAGTVLFESFESSPSPIFGAFNSYAYSQNYTSTVILPDSGERYYTGDLGQLNTSRTARVGIALPTAEGVSAASIDAGLAEFQLLAYFSTYQDQNDWTAVRLQFLDINENPIGQLIEIGGLPFVQTLGFGPNAGGIPNHRDWGLDFDGGIVPAGARAADVTLFTERLAGNAADGYLDFVALTVTEIPEPGGLLMLAAALPAFWRRRRAP